MKLSDKIIRLRKSNGWSQEDLAEKLNVSRQAISRWEGATAQPDAARKNEANEITKAFRKKFYKISAWLGTYFPIRFVVTSLAVYYPRPYSAIIKDCVILAIYLMTATLISLQIEKNNLKEK